MKISALLKKELMIMDLQAQQKMMQLKK